MPYSLISDTHADDPVWDVLADGKTALLDQLQASFVRLNAKASHLLTNGYLTHETALRYCTNRRVLDRLTTRVLDRQPLLHRPTDECTCLDDDWVDGYAYRIHNFLKRNPSRAEYKRDRAQRADLRDTRLKALVHDRDGGCCRYCRSGPLLAKAVRSKDRRKVLQYDHVDPDQAAQPDGTGLVVACARCNEHKGHRRPDEADMVLLPAPTDAEKTDWQARGLALFDLPADHRPITDESTTEQRTDADPNTDPVSDPNGDPNGQPHVTGLGSAGPHQGERHHEQRTAWSAKGPGWVGARPPADPDPTRTAQHQPQPARSPDAPDIYHRRSRAPATSPPLLGGTP